MIRLVVQGKDGPLVVLGLTDENVKRLREDRPIYVPFSRFGEDAPLGDDPSALGVVVLLGETHRSIVDELRKGGVPIPDDVIARAEAIDASL